MLKEKEQIEDDSESIISVETTKSEQERRKSLEKIDNKLNFYHIECERYFVEKLKIIQQCIREDLDVCYLQEFMIGTLQCQIMFKSFRMLPMTPITIINLKNNHLEHFCCHSMASFIELSLILRELNLDGCKIGDKGMEILSPVFATSISIVHLNLSNNHITDDGGEILVSFLMRNYSCRDLNLSSNMLGYKTATAMGEVLQINKTLEKLDISHNQLHERYGIVEIMKALMDNESLECLDISWNGLGGEPLGKILSKSVKKARLKILRMEFNKLSSFEFKKLALGMKYSETIEEVYVGGNKFQPDDDVILIGVFKTESPLMLLSFGDSYHMSHDAFKVSLLS